MYLRSISVQNYRAIRDGSVTLGETTALIGENDCGRSSLLEALLLILGSPGETFETRLKPLHFHRRADGSTGPLRIRLQLSETAAGQWPVPDAVGRALPAPEGGRRRFEFEFVAVLEKATQRIAANWSVSGIGRPESKKRCGQEVLDWLRTLAPVLWLKVGLLAPAGPRDPQADVDDPAVEELELHYRNLVSGETADLFAELDLGLKAAQAVMERYKDGFGGAVPRMSAMASDILDRNEAEAEGPGQHGPVSLAAHKIGVVLMLGSLLQLVRRKIAPAAKPVLVIENLESNLHPMTLAAAWRIVERLGWQKILSTYSGALLSKIPLGDICRLTRSDGVVRQWTSPRRMLSREDLRRVSYHLRSKRPAAMFARCWLLVEGETEFWVLPELARICGVDLEAEGIYCVEFAQCGLPPLTKLADRMGIGWHVLADGDDAGQTYEQTAIRAAARSYLAGSTPADRVTRLPERDIEHCFWAAGFDDVIAKMAYPGGARHSVSPTKMIHKAIERGSKPFLALSLIEAAAMRGADSVPATLRKAIDAVVALARAVR